MGYTRYTDAWSVEQGKPMTEPTMRPVASEPGAEGLAGLASESSSSSTSSSAQGSTIAAELSAWFESAFGPAFAGFGRELGAVARRFTQPMKLEHPWVWIGAAGLVGYVLGRTGVLRPLASFTMRTALTTFVERAMRTG